MAESTAIDIFLRLRPVPRPSPRVILDASEAAVEFNIPKQASAGLINNSREHYRFPFTGILTPDAKQDEVFERVARSIVTSSLTGFNGTIFAYGQTGSGKTFTMTGGAERYVDRGIIPRSISIIFQHIAQSTDCQFQVSISYLEIYNEVGYDLLNPEREVKGLEDLPQVSIQEDEEETIHFKNLTVHKAATEEEALNLLFLGDTNRTISETPMNQASSRSHCIFTLHIEARAPGSDLVRSSKLNLVDLAGSERVGKTGVDGTTLKEAKYINLSLHYLEQVIVALQERSMGLARTHVPYRNSLMTQVLRDSLGGNCRTVMVATINPQTEQLEESISTCRFAQRVALVTNTVSVNEEVDPAAIIARLKQQVRELREEVRLLRGGGPERGPLTQDELKRLQQTVASYVYDPAPEASLDVSGDMLWIRACFTILKQMLQQAAAQVRQQDSNSDQQQQQPAATSGGQQDVGKGAARDAAGDQGTARQQLLEQIRALQLQVQQRDAEIAILTRMLPGAPNGAQQQHQAAASPTSTSTNSSSSTAATKLPPAAAGGDTAAGRDNSDSGAVLSALLDVSLLADRNKAFDLFRKSYRQNEVIEENKALLRSKYEEAKALGARVGGAKAAISNLKAQLEQRRAQRCVAGTMAGASPEEVLQEPDAVEQQLKQQIDQEVSSYKGDFNRLRSLKTEIEHLQLLLEQSRTRLQRDFAAWCSALAAQQQQGQGQAGGGRAPEASAAASAPQQPRAVQAPPQQQLRHQEAAAPAQRPSSGTAPRAALMAAETSSSSGISSSSSRYSQPQLLPAQRPPSAARALDAVRGAAQLGQAADASTLQPGSSSSSSGALQLGGGGPSAARQVQPDWSHVDPAVLAAAAPHLTGNAGADEDIIRFYEARAKLLQKLGRAG